MRSVISPLLCLVGLFLAGCSTTPSQLPDGKNAEKASLTDVYQTDDTLIMPNDSDTPSAAITEPPPKHLWEYLAKRSQWTLPARPEVLAAREYWLTQPQLFSLLSERATPQLQYIVAEIERRELPIELALLPIIESSLNPWAYSSQHAAGLWQITPATADHFGLERSWWFDARYDIPLSTHAALDYLQSLHQRFDGDWYLALAAYNAGPGRVDKALRQFKRNDKASAATYWQLKLPSQTRQYVPKLLGLLSVLRNGGYDGENLPALPIRANWTAVDTGGQIELATAASLAGIDEVTLRRMNPAHLRWATGPEADGKLWLPATSVDQFTVALKNLPTEQRVRWRRYVIQPGDSLIRIARQFDSQVELIREVNQLSGHLIRAGDPLLIPGGGNWAKSLAVAQVKDRTRQRRPQRYRVRQGDSLWEIARRFDVSVARLLEWNGLTADRYLQPGQTLRLAP